MPRALNRTSSLFVAPLFALAPMLLVSVPTAHAQTQPPVEQAPPPAYPPQGAQQPAQPGYPPPQQGYPPPQQPGYPPPQQPGYPPQQQYAQPGYPPPQQPGYPPQQPPQYAPPPPNYAQMRAPGIETHDGFYLRLHLGGGYTTMSASADGNKLGVSGGSASFGLALGGSISPNLVIYGALSGVTISNPDLTVNGETSTTDQISANMSGIGLGAAYYLVPANVYFAGTLMASKLTVTDDSVPAGEPNTVGETDYGFGFEGLVGKEWWVSDNWGLGAAAQLMLASMKDKSPLVTGGSTPTWTAVSFSLLFSATFN